MSAAEPVLQCRGGLVDYSDQECSAVSRAEAAQHLNHTAALLSASLRCAADVTARTNREGGADSYYHTLNFFHELSGVIVVLYMTYMHEVRYHSKCAAASNTARIGMQHIGESCDRSL